MRKRTKEEGKIIGSCRHTSRPLTGWIICIDTFTKWFPDKFNALSWPSGTSSSYGISPISAIDNDFKRWSNFSNETKNQKERKHLIIILSHFGNQISRPTFGFARQPKPTEKTQFNKWPKAKWKKEGKNSLGTIHECRTNPFVCCRWYWANAISLVAPLWLTLILLIYCRTNPDMLNSIDLQMHHLLLSPVDFVTNLPSKRTQKKKKEEKNWNETRTHSKH